MIAANLNRFLFLVLLALLCFVIRLDVVTDRSITQDESTMILFAQGVIEKGYPFLTQKTGEFILSTYELVPYPIAASISILGKTEFAIRLPAMLFACLTACLIFIMGEKFHSKRAGALAALLYIMLPWSIYWGTNSFYPSQLQFFTTLTLLILHSILEKDRPPAYLYYLIAASILLTYYSWEGSGFLLPVFFIAAIVLTWGRWQWLKTMHAWVVAFIILLGVVAQLTFRTVLRAPYTGLGSSRSDVSFLEPAYSSYGFDATYYVSQLATPNNLPILLLFLLAIFLIFRNWNLMFLFLVACLVFIFLTGFLGYYALRYVYFVLPAILVVSATTAVVFADMLFNYIMQGNHRNLYMSLSMLAMIIGSVAIISPWGFARNTNSNSGMVPFELEYDSRGFGFRSLSLALKSKIQEGDIVILQAPFPVYSYTGLSGDYFLQQGTATTVFYHPESSPYYVDKWIQNPVLRSKKELLEVMHKSPRVWFVFTPKGASRSSVGADLYDFILSQTQVISEVADGQLLLWENNGFNEKT